VRIAKLVNLRKKKKHSTKQSTRVLYYYKLWIFILLDHLTLNPLSSEYKYYITFIHNYSRKCYVYLLKHKYEAVHKLIEFHKLIKNTYNYNIKEVKSNNGLGYNNSNFINYFKINGIRFNHFTPGNPQQNGLSERINQILNNYEKALYCTIY